MSSIQIRFEHRGLVAPASEVSEFVLGPSGWEGSGFKATSKEKDRCRNSDRSAALEPVIYVATRRGSPEDQLIAARNMVEQGDICPSTLGIESGDDGESVGNSAERSICTVLLARFEEERAAGRTLPCELAPVASYWGKPQTTPDGQVRVPFRSVSFNGKLGPVEHLVFPAGSRVHVMYPTSLDSPVGRASQAGRRCLKLSPGGWDFSKDTERDAQGFKHLMLQVMDLYAPVLDYRQHLALPNLKAADEYSPSELWMGAYSHRRCVLEVEQAVHAH